MKKSNRSEAMVRALLEDCGFAVEPIERDDERTADFLVRDDDHRYLVEVTGKDPAKNYRDFLDRVESDGHSTISRVVDRHHRFDRALDDKADQLTQTRIDRDFRVAWFTAFHTDAQYVHESLLRTLYGLADLQVLPTIAPAVLLRRSEPPREVICFYYDHFAFYRNRDIDAAAFLSSETVGLFVNPLCPRVAAFRECRLYKEFSTRGGLVDPGIEKASDKVLFLDLNVDRQNERAKWKALRTKYGLFTQRTRDSVFEGLMTLKPTPKDET